LQHLPNTDREQIQNFILAQHTWYVFDLNTPFSHAALRESYDPALFDKILQYYRKGDISSDILNIVNEHIFWCSLIFDGSQPSVVSLFRPLRQLVYSICLNDQKNTIEEYFQDGYVYRSIFIEIEARSCDILSLSEIIKHKENSNNAILIDQFLTLLKSKTEYVKSLDTNPHLYFGYCALRYLLQMPDIILNEHELNGLVLMVLWHYLQFDPMIQNSMQRVRYNFNRRSFYLYALYQGALYHTSLVYDVCLSPFGEKYLLFDPVKYLSAINWARAQTLAALHGSVEKFDNLPKLLHEFKNVVIEG